MGKRARRKGAGGKGARQAFKERQLGISLSGVTKPMLDLMNAEAKAQFGLGIGVVVQELERCEGILASLGEPRWWDRFTQDGRRRRQARADAELWQGRLRDVAAAVSDKAPGREVERWAASR